MVATVRSGEPVPDAVLALWKEGLAERIEVGRLDDRSIGALVDQALGGPVDVALTGQIAARSGGNALFARELCLSGRDAGAIAVVDGRWTSVGPLGVSSRLVGARPCAGRRPARSPNAARSTLSRMASRSANAWRSNSSAPTPFSPSSSVVSSSCARTADDARSG